MLPGQPGDASFQSALYCVASEIIRSVILRIAKEELGFLESNCSKRFEILPVHVFTAESTNPASSLSASRYGDRATAMTWRYHYRDRVDPEDNRGDGTPGRCRATFGNRSGPREIERVGPAFPSESECQKS